MLYLRDKGQEYAPFDPNRVKRIFALFQKDFLQDFSPKVIHIVGTNGKGSTGRYIALSLAKQAQILHFTSPHLFDFQERFYRNDGNVSWQELQRVHHLFLQKSYLHEASYFEYATFLALFLAKDLDYLILEAGLGGEFDSTNVIEDKISVFTQIGYDHKEILGETLDKIAQTKLNAMGKTAFLGIQTYPQVVAIAQEIAQKRCSQLHCLTSFCVNPLFPMFLNHNFALAQKVLEFLNVEPCQMDTLNLPGRMQRIKENIWLDVGHNEDGARAIAYEFRGKKIKLVYNAYSQKDIFKILKILKEMILHVEIIDLDEDRRIDQDYLKSVLKELEIPFQTFERFSNEGEYLVFGSFGVVKKALEILRNLK